MLGFGKKKEEITKAIENSGMSSETLMGLGKKKAEDISKAIESSGVSSEKLLGLGRKKAEDKSFPKSISKVIEGSGLSPESIIFYAEGHNGQVVLTERAVIIGREGFWKKFKSSSYTKGNKSIPYKSITGVQFKEPGITSGYIQFTVPGGFESKGGVFSAMDDENTVAINGKDQLEAFKKIRDIVEEKMNAPSGVPQASTSSIADELTKLAALKKDGLISEEEFIQMKSKLINK